MENATDAIIMAGSVLLFIIALTVSISSLTKLKEQSEEIFSTEVKTEMVQDESGNYLQYITGNEDDSRIVGSETIMESIRRVSKENYDLYIINNESINTSEIPNELKEEVDGKMAIKITVKGNVESKYLTNKVMKKIYEILGKNKYKEQIGIYKEKVASGVLEDERTEFKIITYTQTTS